jgi:hypothetical protein
MSPQLPNLARILFILFPLGLLIAGLIFYPRYTGLSRGKACLALFASLIGGIVTVAAYFVRSESSLRHLEMEPAYRVLAAGVSFYFLTAFGLRLWGRWIGGKSTPEERQPGVPGIRAWFCASNVVIGMAIVLTTWLGFDISPLLMVIIIGALLAADPILRMEASSTPASTTPVADDLSAEREKIVAMLEAGKLTPDESAELLQALSETSRVPVAQPVKLTPGQRLMLIGAALVAFGFFLPWFVVNPGKEAGRLMNQMKVSFPLESSFPGTNLSLPHPTLQTPSISISGGDIQKGLGWMALLLAGSAALIPYITTRLDESTMRTVRLLCLGVGSLIVLYLLTQNIRFIGIGLVIAVSGYIVEIVGVIRESKLLKRLP